MLNVADNYWDAMRSVHGPCLRCPGNGKGLGIDLPLEADFKSDGLLRRNQRWQVTIVVYGDVWNTNTYSARYQKQYVR